MKRIQLEFVSEGFREILCSEEVGELVINTARKIADKATSTSHSKRHYKEPPIFEAKGPKLGGYGGGRQVAYVSSANEAAYREAVFAHRLEKTIYSFKGV